MYTINQRIKEVKIRLSQWRTWEIKCVVADLAKAFEYVHEIKTIDGTKNVSGVIIKAYYDDLMKALKVLTPFEYYLIKSFYYNNDSCKKTQFELNISEASYYRTKQQAILKIADVIIMNIE